MVNFETMMDDVADIASAPTIQFGESKYAFFWTSHARFRATSQGILEEDATTTLLAALNAINEAGKAGYAVDSGYFCIRDLEHGFFAVCHLTESNKRLRVVTYDGLHVLFPREGDLTYQLTKDDIIVRIWSKF